MSLYFSNLVQVAFTALNSKPLPEITGEDRKKLIQKICTSDHDNDYCIEWCNPVEPMKGEFFQILPDEDQSDISICYRNQSHQIERSHCTRFYQFFSGTIVVYSFDISKPATAYNEDTIKHKHHTKFMYIADKHEGSRRFYYAVIHSHEALDMFSDTNEPNALTLEALVGMLNHDSDAGSGRD